MSPQSLLVQDGMSQHGTATAHVRVARMLAAVDSAAAAEFVLSVAPSQPRQTVSVKEAEELEISSILSKGTSVLLGPYVRCVLRGEMGLSRSGLCKWHQAFIHGRQWLHYEKSCHYFVCPAAGKWSVRFEVNAITPRGAQASIRCH